MGTVGLIAFGFFYFWRYRSLLAHRKNPAYIALLAGLALFDAYGMIDTNFFGPTFFIMLLCISLVADINLPDGRYRAFGGRNPFADIANGCKAAVARINDKIKSKNESEDSPANEGTPASENNPTPKE